MPGFLPNSIDPSSLVPNPSSPQVPGALGSLAGQVNGLLNLVGLGKTFGADTTGAPRLPEKMVTSADPLLGDLVPIKDTYTFVRWPALIDADLLDYRNLYPYEFVISLQDPVTSQTSPLMSLIMQLPPTNISVSIPNAVNLSVTQNGILEESNAAPLRSISMSGTTGIVNSDLAATAKPSGLTSVLDYAFKNTISAASSILSSANTAVQAGQKVAGSVFGTNSGQLGYPINTAIDASNNSALLRRTGYYAFHDMARFFEAYMAFKKTGQGRYYRLMLNMHKDRMYYYVTLNSFNWQKLPGTLEYNYSISLTAWRMTDGPNSEKTTALQLPAPAQDPLALVKNTLQSVATAATTIRNTGSILLRGIKSDYANVQQNLFEPTRQLILALKGASGAATTAADLPQSIVAAGSGGILATLNAQLTSDSALASAIDSSSLKQGLFGNPQASGNPGTMGQSALSDSINEQSINNLSPAATQPTSSSPAQQIFNDPVRYASILDQIKVSDVQFSQALNQDIQQEVSTVNSLNLQDYQTRRAAVMQFSSLYANSVGAGDATYNRVNGYAPPSNPVNTLTVDDIQMLSAINDIVIGFNNIIALMSSLVVTPGNDYFKYYVSYAVNNGFQQLKDAQSKFLVPFPAGSSLEALAGQYLQNIDRWPEIAAVNGLKEPYVDEEGYFISLIGNGASNTVLLSNPEKLYIGAVVFLQSNTQVAKQFKITQINVIDVNNTLIIFQDDDDLSPYKTADNAQVHAYLPDTVNSMKLIAIPSQGAPNTATRIQIGPGVQDLAGLSQISKTDFLLNSGGDWVVSSGGNLLLATGYTNLVQAANIKLYTQLGSMLNHPQFGNPVQPGSSSADINVSKTLQILNSTFAADPRFSGIIAGQAVLKGPALAFNLLIGISSTNTNLPITALVPVN